ncbi:uncharacterized protein IWZ02DRAFT_438758 [Phyllosticta citriasiana]|uniref:uncharacterized protein n=1 Tax=Phyllosticta citriasiana TaxID=595635 RepID=UPI0030FD928F
MADRSSVDYQDCFCCFSGCRCFVLGRHTGHSGRGCFVADCSIAAGCSFAAGCFVAGCSVVVGCFAAGCCRCCRCSRSCCWYCYCRYCRNCYDSSCTLPLLSFNLCQTESVSNRASNMLERKMTRKIAKRACVVFCRVGKESTRKSAHLVRILCSELALDSMICERETLFTERMNL